MSRPVITTIILICAQWLALFQKTAAQTLSDQVSEQLRNRIEAAGVPPKITVQGEPIHASVTLPIFYERRAYRPAWCEDNRPLQQVERLINAIRDAGREGLRPADYHLAKIETTLREVDENQSKKKSVDSGWLVDLDLLLTDAFLIYGSHLLAGRVNPETIDPEWFANRREADLAAILHTALDSEQIEQTLKSLLPPQPGYARLQQALVHYRHLAENGGLPIVREGPKMQKGDSDEGVMAMRARLVATGDLDDRSHDGGDVFDDALQQAVLRFQQRHGLDADGVVGPATLAALNVSAEERIRQIEVNMERWRWLPQDLGKRYVLVNIANFELEVVDSGQSVMTMRVVVGKNYRRTPVFSDNITYLVLNPHWNVPPSLAIQDMLPQLRKDPNYLAEKNIRVFQGWGGEAKEIDPSTIDWSKVTSKNFNYRFRQEPGPANALGQIKFMCPNRFNVYLHDTPSRELFAKVERAFSSGCIRIEKPIELAMYTLQDNREWSREKILTAMDKGTEQTIFLPEPVAMHLLYWTAWADEDGSVHFRKDLYRRDKRLDEALRQEPPTS